MRPEAEGSATDGFPEYDFIMALDRMKEISRQTYLSDGSRRENDAEHSFHMAVMTFLLSEYADRPLDVGKTVEMALLHDVIEIDAGDTYAYDPAGNETKAAREKAAAARLYGLLPKEKGAYYRALWEEFEERSTPEAVFANAMDCLQPLLLNDKEGGSSWREHGVKKSQVLSRIRRIEPASAFLYAYAVSLVEKHVACGDLIDA